LNNYLSKALLVVLLLLTSSLTSSSDYFLGTRVHPSSVTQSNVPKAFTMAFGVLSNASIFLSSCSSCVSFGVPISVDCLVSSLGEPFVFLVVVCAVVTSTSSSMG
jgi:hypothetical protein